MGIHNWTQTGKGTYIRTLCQKNKGSVEMQQRPIKMDSRTIHRTLSSKRTPFQTGTDRRPHLWKVPRKRWISHTYSMWLWGHSLFKISSPGSVSYESKWLLWRPHKFIRSVVLIKGKHNRPLNVAVQGQNVARPSYILTYIHTFG
jgi:hypothetical protein